MPLLHTALLSFTSIRTSDVFIVFCANFLIYVRRTRIVARSVIDRTHPPVRAHPRVRAPRATPDRSRAFRSTVSVRLVAFASSRARPRAFARRVAHPF
jgi:hypothetical protein